MIFLVRGMERDGMVSLEAHKRAGNYHFDMLSLDLKAKPERGLQREHLFLAGSDDHALFADVTELLEASRASGLRHKQVDDDPDLAEEAPGGTAER